MTATQSIYFSPTILLALKNQRKITVTQWSPTILLALKNQRKITVTQWSPTIWNALNWSGLSNLFGTKIGRLTFAFPGIR
jgi:hypothetical protein